MGGAAPVPPPPAATPAPTPAPTPVAPTTTTAATSVAATTSTAAPAVAGSQCCYGGVCASLTTESCNAADTWCSQTADNCGHCGGTLCYMVGAAPVPPPPAATPAPTAPVSVAPSGGEGDENQCCYASACVDDA